MDISESSIILRQLIKQFKENQSEKSFMDILAFLHESQVIVPITVEMDEADYDEFIKTNQGEILANNDNIRIKPDILVRSDNKEKMFPVFTSADRMPPDYSARFATINLPFIKCIDMVNTDDCKKIIIDAFTENLIIPSDFFDTIKSMRVKIVPGFTDNNEKKSDT